MTNNEKRAERAYRLMLTHCQSTGTDFKDDDHRTVFTDLLTDMRHLADQYGVDFDDAVGVSEYHYKEEVNDPNIEA